MVEFFRVGSIHEQKLYNRKFTTELLRPFFGTETAFYTERFLNRNLI